MTRAFTLLVLTFSFVFSAYGQASPTMTIKVFFHNEKLNPNQQDCTERFGRLSAGAPARSDNDSSASK